MTKLPHKSLERALLAAKHGLVVGVDEVGMGCLAGPVVVCAAVFTPQFYQGRWRSLEHLRDSKLLASHQREQFARALKAHPHVRYAIAVIPPRQIDQLNIYQAARLGMRRAIARLKLSASHRPVILVDGPHAIEGIALPQRAIVKGDQSVFAIAAASVLAKVHRDALMTRAAQRYPGYGFEVHKGYGTPAHRASLRALGPSAFHRKSFTLL